jgi:hypothetical protein
MVSDSLNFARRALALLDKALVLNSEVLDLVFAELQLNCYLVALLFG